MNVTRANPFVLWDGGSSVRSHRHPEVMNQPHQGSRDILFFSSGGLDVFDTGFVPATYREFVARKMPRT